MEAGTGIIRHSQARNNACAATPAAMSTAVEAWATWMRMTPIRALRAAYQAEESRSPSLQKRVETLGRIVFAGQGAAARAPHEFF